MLHLLVGLPEGETLERHRAAGDGELVAHLRLLAGLQPDGLADDLGDFALRLIDITAMVIPYSIGIANEEVHRTGHQTGTLFTNAFISRQNVDRVFFGDLHAIDFHFEIIELFKATADDPQAAKGAA